MKFCINIEGYENNYQLTLNEIKYLKLIFKHIEEGNNISLTTLAKLLGIRPSSATDTIENLIKKGLIDKSRGKITLTEEGEKLVKFIFMKKRILELYFFYVLNLNAKESKYEAEKIDYLVSCKLIEKMLEVLNKRKIKLDICPHGKLTYCDEFFNLSMHEY